MRIFDRPSGHSSLMYVGTQPDYSPSFAQRWQRALGVRPEEASTVRLFFVHNFLLGIGTVLIYVAANAILLEHQPDRNLPLAYVTSAAAMIGVGRLYAHYEHHLLLRSLAARSLLAVVAMTAVVAVLVVVGHSVAAAVAIMVGYRVVYLLANLEFWGVSAVVFDTRQSKRLFGVISSGDMPAKALGAVLAALVHAHTGILLLVLTAFGAFGLAFYTLQLTVRSHDVQVAHRPARRSTGREPSRLAERRFGGSELILLMCVSLALLAAVATGIEYSFFVNVKHRFHNQADVIRYVSYVLALTYGLAMVAKLLLSGPVLDRFGVRRSLLVLPVVAFVALVGLMGLSRAGADEAVRMVYFCGLYLVFEVIRRALFDPVFLVLFQPLSPPQRLKGHTLAKGLYEPLGLGVAGLLLLLLHAHPAADYYVPVFWMMLLAGAAYGLRLTYRHYLHELNDAIGRRFLERDQLAMPTAARSGLLNQLKSPKPTDVLTALSRLQTDGGNELNEQLPALLTHPASAVRHWALTLLTTRDYPPPVGPLTHVALGDSEPALRTEAAYLLGRRINAEPDQLASLLNHSDLAIRQGALRGVLELNPHDTAARRSLTALTTDANPVHQQTALHLIGTLRLTDYAPVVRQHFADAQPDLAKAAYTAAGQLSDPALLRYLADQLNNPTTGRVAAQAMRSGGSAVVTVLRERLKTDLSPVVAVRMAGIGGAIRTADSRRLLLDLLNRPELTIREAALRALRRFAPDPADEHSFRALLPEDVALAQRLLHGRLTDPDLSRTLDYELTRLLGRLFDVLAQLYEPETIAGARLGVGHSARERRANALEMLDNLIPRDVYQTMQVLVDDLPVAEKVRLLDNELGTFREPEPIRAFVLRAGETVFSTWTVTLVWRSLPKPEPAQSMNHSNPAPDALADYDRVMLLANTRLFAETPENVLASVTPILKEENHSAGTLIVQKGDLGTALYVIDAGEVLVRDGDTELARFGRGDFFGELALLDAEARSATVEALTDVRVLRLDQDDFYDLMEERGEVLRSIVRSLSGRIRRQNELLAAQKAN